MSKDSIKESVSSGQLNIDIAHAMPPHKEEWVRGDPGPLGLLCFGMTMCMLMFLQSDWVESAFLPTIFCYALFYAGMGEIIVGVLELIKGNTFGGTVFVSYGAFWCGFGMLNYLTLMYPGTYKAAPIGMTLWCCLWNVLTIGFCVISMRKNVCLFTIFATLIVTFALLAAGQWNVKCAEAAGYFGFLCGASGIYAAFAFLYSIELGYKLPGVAPIHWV